MVFPFLNPPPAIGCGDPGDPIDFGVLFTGTEYQQAVLPAGDRRKASLVFPFKLGGSTASTTEVIFNSPQPSAGTNGFSIQIYQNRLRVIIDDGTNYWVGQTSSLLRDYAAHYLAHLKVNTEHADSAARFVLTIGGKQYPLATAAGSIPAQNANLHFGVAGTYAIGRRPVAADNYLKSPLSQFIFINGLELDHTEFEYLNFHKAWVWRKYSGKGNGAATYGANGFHLDFADPLDLGKDVSGNSNHFTATGLTVDNQVTDTPTHSFNTNDRNNTQTTVTLSNGNLTGTYASTANVGASAGTMPISAGRYYWEVKVNTLGGFENDIGVIPWRSMMVTGNPYSYTSGIVGAGEVVYCKDGGISRNGTYTTGYGASFTTGDVIGVLVDCEEDTINFSKNGVWQGQIDLCAKPFLTTNTNYGGSVMTSNFGQRAFVHPIPSGAKTLNTANLPCPEILDPTDGYQFEQVSGGAGVAMNWNPLLNDTLVLTGRTDGAYGWRVNMIIGGLQVDPFDTSGAAGPILGEAGGVGLTFNASGYTIGGTAALQGIRRDRIFRMGPKRGMALVTFTHLNGTPTVVPHIAGGLAEQIWFFPVSGGDRRVYHKAVGGNAYLRINGSGQIADAGWITHTAQSFTISGNMPSGTYHAWVVRSVPQYSSVFSYSGNASATDGAFAPMDFEAQTVMGRNTTENTQYFLKDNLLSNPNSDRLRLSNASENAVAWPMDFHTNGIKFFDSSGDVNAAQIYAGFAIARTPGKFARAR